MSDYSATTINARHAQRRQRKPMTPVFRYKLLVDLDESENFLPQPLVVGTFDTLKEAYDILDAAPNPGCMTIRKITVP